MENILIVLVAIGGFVYKIYSNYKEEMEKAKKRQASMRPTPPSEIPTPKSTRTHRTPPPVPVTSYQTEPVKTKENKTFDFPEEVRKIREQKDKATPSKRALEVEERKTDVLEFDLRQAVIQSAILERPYK